MFEAHIDDPDEFVAQYLYAAEGLTRVVDDLDAVRFAIETLLGENGILNPEKALSIVKAFSEERVDHPLFTSAVYALEELETLAGSRRLNSAKVLTRPLERNHPARKAAKQAAAAQLPNITERAQRQALWEEFRRHNPSISVLKPVVQDILNKRREAGILTNAESALWLAESEKRLLGSTAARNLHTVFNRGVQTSRQTAQLMRTIRDAQLMPTWRESDQEKYEACAGRQTAELPFATSYLAPGVMIDLLALDDRIAVWSDPLGVSLELVRSTYSNPLFRNPLDDKIALIQASAKTKEAVNVEQLVDPPCHAFMRGADNRISHIFATIPRPASAFEETVAARYAFPIDLCVPYFRERGLDRIEDERAIAMHEHQRLAVFSQINRWIGKYGISVSLKEAEEFRSAGFIEVNGKAAANGFTRIEFVHEAGIPVTFYQDRHLQPKVAMEGPIDRGLLYGLSFWATRFFREYLTHDPERTDAPDFAGRAMRVGSAILHFDPTFVYLGKKQNGEDMNPSRDRIEAFLIDNPGLNETDFKDRCKARKLDDTAIHRQTGRPGMRNSTWRSGIEKIIFGAKPKRIIPPPGVFRSHTLAAAT